MLAFGIRLCNRLGIVHHLIRGFARVALWLGRIVFCEEFLLDLNHNVLFLVVSGENSDMRVVLIRSTFLCIELLLSCRSILLRLLPTELSISSKQCLLSRLGCGSFTHWSFLLGSYLDFLQLVRPLHVGESLIVLCETEFLLLDFDEHAIDGDL